MRFHPRNAWPGRVGFVLILALTLALGWGVGLGLVCAGAPPPAEARGEVDALAVEAWLRDNLDEDAFQLLLGEVDFQRVQSVLGDLLRKSEARDVYDLSSVADAARQVLPLLKEYEETQPYAAWLETQLDYLEMSETLRRAVTPSPPRPGATPVRPSPGPEKQRPFWDQRLSRRAWPPAAESLVPRLKPIFRSVGVPAEMIWLAEVESAFNPRARSPKGAAGLFQLMPATAESLGLSTGWWIDDRLNVDDNARAAARYLRQLYQRFGDWRLTLAAYNAGEGRVGRLLAGSKSKSFADIAAWLPAETQLYVPRFEATLRRREGVALRQIGPVRMKAGPAKPDPTEPVSGGRP